MAHLIETKSIKINILYDRLNDLENRVEELEEINFKANAENIYIVSHCHGGGMQDYTIVGIFSDKKTADKIYKEYKDGIVENFKIGKRYEK